MCTEINYNFMSIHILITPLPMKLWFLWSDTSSFVVSLTLLTIYTPSWMFFIKELYAKKSTQYVFSFSMFHFSRWNLRSTMDRKVTCPLIAIGKVDNNNKVGRFEPCMWKWFSNLHTNKMLINLNTARTYILREKHVKHCVINF